MTTRHFTHVINEREAHLATRANWHRYQSSEESRQRFFRLVALFAAICAVIFLVVLR